MNCVLRKGYTMPKQNPAQAAASKKNASAKKGDEQNPKESGTTKPLPTPADTPPAEKSEIEKKVAEMAAKRAKEVEETKAKLEALKKELEAAKAKEKEEKELLKQAKNKEKELALKARAEKEAKIAELDERIKAAEADLAKTEEWAALEALKKERSEVGPLPKVPKVGGGGGGGAGRTRGPSAKGAGGLNGSELRTMKAISEAGHALSRKELAEATGQTKGWSKLLGSKAGGGDGLCDRGLLNLVMHEDEPMRYSLTDHGKSALEAALKELATKEAEDTAKPAEEATEAPAETGDKE
jgi:hypothetical protein